MTQAEILEVTKQTSNIHRKVFNLVKQLIPSMQDHGMINAVKPLEELVFQHDAMMDSMAKDMGNPETVEAFMSLLIPKKDL